MIYRHFVTPFDQLINHSLAFIHHIRLDNRAREQPALF
jgi:hypothetical protein